MALDFPSSPTNGQTYGNYYYDATVGAWNSFSSTTNTIPSTLKNLSITTDTASTIPLTVKGATSQTADLQQWLDSTGAIKAEVASDGTITATSLTLTNDLTVANGGTGAGTFTTGAYLKGNGTNAIQAQTGIPFADVTMQAIPAAADLNTYTTQGIYHQGSDAQASGGTNYPIARAGLLEVYQSGTDGSGFTYQRYTVYQSFHAVYTRAKYTTTWGAWEEIPTGTVTVAQGGTGATTLTSGAYLKGAGTSTITAQTGIPATDITSGILPIARGGTGVANGTGLIPIVPTSVTMGSGTATRDTNTGRVTFSGGGIILNGVFSNTYTNYIVRIEMTGTSQPNDYVYWRFTQGGSYTTVAAYYGGCAYNQGTTLSTFQSNQATAYVSMGYAAASGGNTYAINVFAPYNSAGGNRPTVSFHSSYENTSVWGTSKWNGGATFDGFWFYAAGNGTLTGNVTVYGLQ